MTDKPKKPEGWTAYLEAFIGPGALATLRQRFDADKPPGGADHTHRPRS